MLRMATMATAQARVRGSSNRPATEGAVQKWFPAITAQWRRRYFGADCALGDEFDAPTDVRINREELQDTGPGHQETPPVEDFAVRALEVVV